MNKDPVNGLILIPILVPLEQIQVFPKGIILNFNWQLCCVEQKD